jgi:hypothetical protein
MSYIKSELISLADMIASVSTGEFDKIKFIDSIDITGLEVDDSVYSYKYIKLISEEIDKSNNTVLFKVAAKLSIWLLFNPNIKTSLSLHTRLLYKENKYNNDVYLLVRTFITNFFRSNINYRSEVSIKTQEKYIKIISVLYQLDEYKYDDFIIDLRNCTDTFDEVKRYDQLLTMKETLLESSNILFDPWSLARFISNIDREIKFITKNEVNYLLGN